MKVFTKNNKINFVDENNVFLGYDMMDQCCETAEWFIADAIFNKIPKQLDALKNTNLDGFVFDTGFFIQTKDSGEFDDGGMVVFKIFKGSECKFIHLYNVHNGYYAHGFEMSIEGEKYRSELI